MSVTDFIGIVIAAALGYFLGSINSAIIVSKIVSGKDIREFGSGNAGMTNVLRTFGKVPAAFTVLGDFSKGIIAVLLARVIFSAMGIDFMDGAYVAGFFALLGHLFPIYFGFKGGKGVLISAAIILVINPIVFLVLVVTFFTTVFISKIVSLSSIISAVVYPIATLVVLYINNQPVLGSTLFALLMSVIVIYMHRENIKRLINGTENKFGQKKQK